MSTSFPPLLFLLLLLCYVCYLQTKEGKEAVGLTSMEFEDVMDQIRQHAEAKLAPELKAAGLDCGDILYSWDNDRTHVGAELATVGIADDMRLELPECSSDMHKVIEHVHANIQREFDEWLWGFTTGKPTVQECKDKVEEIFTQVVSSDSVKSDVYSLHKTYDAIIKANGGYIAKTFR